MTSPNAGRSVFGSVTGRTRGAAVVCLWLWSALSAPGAEPRNRVPAPEDAPCSRDQLTLYEGSTSRYARNDTALDLTIDTDWDTHESVTLRAADDAALRKRLRLNGKSFAAKDWTALELPNGRLRDGLRVRVWLCRRGGTLVPERIDWTTADTR